MQSVGMPPPDVAGVQETPQQQRRRLLQAAKRRTIDQHWPLTGMVTVEMRAEAKLAIDRELRNEPLDEFTPQEVNELAETRSRRLLNSTSALPSRHILTGGGR